ncbi:MAG TPA: hypothetical protein VJM76_05870 [Gammaproteobacteria bacterium]|nr:hypothetical protein [Gammaproteobacteria bacterium]
MEAQRITTRRSYFSWISWGAIFAGLVVGTASYMLLTLLGIAAGLSAIDPQSAEPVGSVPIATGIWTGVSMWISAFVGGYVAARMSGLSRLADGIFHGFVAWGVTTLLFAYLATTAMGSLLGGAVGMLGQGLKTVGQGVTATATSNAGGGGAMSQLETLIKGDNASAGNITTESLNQLQDRLRQGDRAGAVSLMVEQMGFSSDRANTVADQGLALYGQSPQARQAADQAVNTLAAASWWLFFGILLSMALGIWGGAVGVRTTSHRSTESANTLRTT